MTSGTALARVARSSWIALSQASTERDTVLLLGKAALATVLAWQFAVRVLHWVSSSHLAPQKGSAIPPAPETTRMVHVPTPFTGAVLLGRRQ